VPLVSEGIYQRAVTMTLVFEEKLPEFAL